ncbi:hypothetical protein MMC30_002431 [Trapelia coarctata]|nr:hypothetical protein [Trapelia coarctata]
MADPLSPRIGYERPDELASYNSKEADPLRLPGLRDAAAAGMHLTVEGFLKSGADPHERDYDGSTTLIHAAKQSRDCDLGTYVDTDDLERIFAVKIRTGG